MKNTSLYIKMLLLLIAGCGLFPNELIGQDEMEAEVKKNQISLGWRYAYLPRWDISTPYNLELSYTRRLLNPRFSLQARYGIITYCTQCFGLTDRQITPSTLKPSSVEYNLFSILIAYSPLDEMGKPRNMKFSLGPIYRDGADVYFIGNGPTEVFFSSRSAADWGVDAQLSYELPLLKLLSLKLTGEYQFYFSTKVARNFDFKPAKEGFLAGAHIVFNF